MVKIFLGEKKMENGQNGQKMWVKKKMENSQIVEKKCRTAKTVKKKG